MKTTQFDDFESIRCRFHMGPAAIRNGRDRACAALLSATCETNIGLAMQINIESSHIAFRIADEFGCKLFIPSSIGAFGPASPLEAVPDVCYQRPHTFYGVSKVYTEMLGEYYHVKRGMDFRCLRYPGIISPIAEPGGGTTDYAVDIYKQIIGGKKRFECYLESDARHSVLTFSLTMNSITYIRIIVFFSEKEKYFQNLKTC